LFMLFSFTIIELFQSKWAWKLMDVPYGTPSTSPK